MTTPTYNHILAHASAQCVQVHAAGGDRTYNTTAMLATAYLSARFNIPLSLTSADILQLMNLLAVARTVTNPQDKDAYVEQAATSAGAAYANGIKFPEPEATQQGKPDMYAEAAKTIFDPAKMKEDRQASMTNALGMGYADKSGGPINLEDEISKLAEDKSVKDMANKLRPKQ